MKPTIQIYHDTRRSKKSGRYPVKIRVTFQRQAKYYPVDLDVTEEEFLQIQNPQINGSLNATSKRKLKEYKLKMDVLVGKAAGIVENLKAFDFQLFERQMFGIQLKAESDNLYQYYEKEIEKKVVAGNVGTASNYRCSLHSLQKFRGKMKFRDVAPEFLHEYKNWLLSNGKSISTVGIYLRPLRAILTKAIDDRLMDHDKYPFGKRKFQIPAGKNIKKALTSEEITLIYNYQGIPGTWFQKARDFFIFSYLANGMNMKDILLLRYDNIDGDFLRFYRAKTKHTNVSRNKPISIPIHPEIKAIISRWRGNDQKAADYIFDILEPNCTPLRELVLVQQFTKMVNRYIKQIAFEVGINKPITTYYARPQLRNSFKTGRSQY